MKLFLFFLVIGEVSVAQLPECIKTVQSPQQIAAVQDQITKKLGQIDPKASYQLALHFQLSPSSESLKFFPGETPLSRRQRLIADRKSAISEANKVFINFLAQNGLSQIYIPGPQNLAIWTIAASIKELEFILNSSDNCEIYKVDGALLN